MTAVSYVQKHTVMLGNTLTKLSVKVVRKNEAGTDVEAVDLDSKTLYFSMINAATGKTVVEATSTGITVVTAASGDMDYDFSSSGVSVPGIYYAYVDVDSGGEKDTFPVETGHLQIWVNSKTMEAEEAYRLQLEYSSKDTIVLQLNDSARGRLLNFPDTLNVGDSYLESVDNHMEIYIRNAAQTPLTAVGTKAFADGDFIAKLTISQDNASSLVTGTCVWVPASGPTEGYLKCEFPRDQTRRAGEGTARLQLMFRWGGTVEVLAASRSVEWLNKNIRT